MKCLICYVLCFRCQSWQFCHTNKYGSSSQSLTTIKGSSICQLWYWSADKPICKFHYYKPMDCHLKSKWYDGIMHNCHPSRIHRKRFTSMLTFLHWNWACMCQWKMQHFPFIFQWTPRVVQLRWIWPCLKLKTETAFKSLRLGCPKHQRLTLEQNLMITSQ